MSRMASGGHASSESPAFSADRLSSVPQLGITLAARNALAGSGVLQAEDLDLSVCNSLSEAAQAGGDRDARTARARTAHAAQAPKAPLDLIEDHLTEGSYVPASRGLPDGLDPRGWERPNIPGWQPSDLGNIVLKVQAFQSGGYECSARRLNLPELARMSDGRRHHGKREKPAEVDPEVTKKNAKRAKRNVRLACKNIGVDRLMTLTRRESEPAEFWDRQEWAKAWDKFVRLCKRAGVDLVYVAVLEDHKKGNHHLHVALTGHAPVNLLRQIWWACCGGRGMGNVDIKRRRTHDRMHRTAKIASYISKYIAKQFEDSEFNKKRYWASRQSLPDVRRVILRAENVQGALLEVADLLGLDVFKLTASKYSFFTFPDSKGFWIAYHEELATPPPF